MGIPIRKLKWTEQLIRTVRATQRTVIISSRQGTLIRYVWTARRVSQTSIRQEAAERIVTKSA